MTTKMKEIIVQGRNYHIDVKYDILIQDILYNLEGISKREDIKKPEVS